MAHLFEGKPDARQSEEPLVPSRFRPVYRPLSDEEKALHDALKATAADLEALIEKVRDLRPIEDPACFEAGRALAQSMVRLEEAVVWAVKGLTA